MQSNDDLGPEVVMHVYDPETKMKGVIVLDNLHRGPAKGGIRMAESADEQEVRGLARAMTLKNALANLPFGGGKSGITINAKTLSEEQKEAQVRAFGKYLAMVAPKNYVAAPDIAMAEKEMRILAEIAGPKSITGKPTDIGGIPHELGSTGYGVYVSVREWLQVHKKEVRGQTIAVQGFGNVGSFAAKFLVEDKAVLIAASDSTATIIDENGLDVEELMQFKQAGNRFADYERAEKKDADEVLYLDVDVLIPAAQREVITHKNQDRIQARLISQGANLPIPEEVEELLEERGIHNIPDILANAGGVISSWVEHEGGSQDEIFEHIEKIISNNIAELTQCMREEKCSARKAAEKIAKKRLHE